MEQINNILNKIIVGYLSLVSVCKRPQNSVPIQIFRFVLSTIDDRYLFVYSNLKRYVLNIPYN